MQSNGVRSSAASASWPVATAVVCTSPLPISSTMLLRSTSLSSTTSRFFTVRSMNPPIVVSAAFSASCVTGLPRCAMAPSFNPRSASSVTEMMCTGNVPRRRVVLQAIEHRPAVERRQVDVEGDGVGLDLLRERQADVAAHGHDRLESLLARRIDQDRREVEIVLHDEQHLVPGLDVPRGRRG